MPSSIVSYNKRGDSCRFDEEAHTYTLNDLIPLISVTQLIQEFVQPFDAKAAAARYAEKHGLSDPEEVIAQWEEKKAAACLFGTRVHETAEDCLKGRDPRNTPRDDRERAYFSAVWEEASRIASESKEIIGVERMVFCPQFQIAGTIDLVTRDKAGVVWISDWKTNEDLRKPGYGRMMLPPLSALEDKSMNHYTLQLGFYHLMLALEGAIKPEDVVRLRLLWVKPDGVENVEVDAGSIQFEIGMILGSIQRTSWFQSHCSPF